MGVRVRPPVTVMPLMSAGTMDQVSTVIISIAVIFPTFVLLGVVVQHAIASERRPRPMVAASAVGRHENAIPSPPHGKPAVGLHAPSVLVGPPVVHIGDNDYTLRDWLVHYTQREHVWRDVVAAFYTRAAADPQIASYFADVDMEKLQRHFTAAITMVAHRGLTFETLEKMRTVHAPVRDQDMRPITGDIFDRTTSVLVGVLLGMGVPVYAIEHLDRVIAPLRAALVMTHE